MVPPGAMHGVDEEARKVAIRLAAKLGIQCYVNLNLLPRSVQASDAPILNTIDAAVRCGLPITSLFREATSIGLVVDH